MVVRQNGRTPDKRFLIPGSRLLSNLSDSEPCEAALKVPRGYLTTKGHWLAMSPRPRVLVPPAKLQIEILTTPDMYETEAQGGAYMDRDLAEWDQAFTWDAQRTITQTYEGRISQAVSFASQFQEGISRDQFSKYLDTIEAQASFMSFLDPIRAYLTPKLIFIGSLCSVAICCFTGAMSLHGAYQYVQQSRLAQVTVSVVTVMKLLCCAPAAILADKMYRHSFAACMDRDYGYIPELHRAERRRAMRSLPTVKSEQQNNGGDKGTEERQAEGTYAEALLPLVKVTPSAPTYEQKRSIITPLPTIVPFIYTQIQGTLTNSNELRHPLPHVL